MSRLHLLVRFLFFGQSERKTSFFGKFVGGESIFSATMYKSFHAMVIPMRPLLLFLISITLVAAELPKAAQTAVDKSQQAIDRIEADALLKVKKEKESLAVALTKAQELLTKNGDLDGAMAVKKKIADLRDEVKATAKPSIEPWWTKITDSAGWDAIEGQSIVVPSTSTDFDTQVQVPAGRTFVIIPRPGDTWATGAAWPQTGADGDVSAVKPRVPYVELPLMAMVVIVSSKPQSVGKNPIITGPLRVHLRSNDGLPEDNVGLIRVKIVPVDQK